MKIRRLIVLGLLGLVLALGLTGCKIISASPAPGAVIEMKPGDKVVFKVAGPVNTPITTCVWSVNNHYVSEGKNEFEFNFNADSQLSNKDNIIACEYQSYQYRNCGQGCSGFVWVTIDSRKWEVRTNPNSATVITGNYIIQNDSDLQLLKGYTTVTGSLIITGGVENLEGLDKLTALGGDMQISNPHIKDLTGLKSITSIGGSINIRNNLLLTSLYGLENLTMVCGDLIVAENYSLASLSGLENITSVGRDLWVDNNYALTNLSGLENLISIDRDLYIRWNDFLTSLGMSDLQKVGSGLEINDNPILCRSLAEELMNQVLAGSGIGGTWNIDGNKDCTTP